MPARGVRVDLVTSVTDAETVELWPVYEAVFGDVASREAWRAQTWDRHRVRSGFRLVRAREDGRLVGFGYGYTGELGQWWTDQAARTLPRDVATAWLGGHFELVSIGVLASARGHGAGRALMEALVERLPHQRWLLMTTADEHDPARRLYDRLGWRVLGPGLTPQQVVMGRRAGDDPLALLI